MRKNCVQKTYGEKIMLIYTLIKYSNSFNKWQEVASGNELNSNTAKLAMLSLYNTYKESDCVLLEEYDTSNDSWKFITH